MLSDGYLDYLSAVQTAPYNSWANPCERLLSILNLGLQCVSTERTPCSEQMESTLRQCNSMSTIRDAAEKNDSLKTEVAKSLETVISLIENRFERLHLKENSFQTRKPANSS